jgi:hypothetical protein
MGYFKILITLLRHFTSRDVGALMTGRAQDKKHYKD